MHPTPSPIKAPGVSNASPPALGLRHVALRVRDLAAAERFFVDVLGYRVEWRPDPENVYLIRHGDNVALHRAEPAPGQGLLDHVGLLVARAEDVDAWAAHLDGIGANVISRPRTHRDGARSLYLAGPEGLVVQIIHHPPALVP
jgi:catechol 2,3-dioxygenase-like lactoylglutathione lyase family enzyme